MSAQALKNPHVINYQSHLDGAPTAVSEPSYAEHEMSAKIASQLKSGYNHPVSASWQAERSLAKVSYL